jgi:protein translocase SecG subunit
MGFIIGVLTVVLALDSLFLILLILIQLPKKEAGIGTAFGGAATDALFGAGKGNALTNLTKYCAIIFLGLSLFLAIVTASHPGQSVVRQIATGTNSVPESPNPSQKPSSSLTNVLEKTNAAAPNILLQATNIAVPSLISTSAPVILSTNPPTIVKPSAASTNK